MKWEQGRLLSGRIRSSLGGACRLRLKMPVKISGGGKRVRARTLPGNVIEFPTAAGGIYEIRSR
jgi:hypothetical protein